jgi:hypothetical protein
MLVVLLFVYKLSLVDHSRGHAFEPQRLAPDLPEPGERLLELYTVYVVHVYVAGVDLKHVALYSPQQGLSLIA